eukprot:TRINITY_DN389_c0_g1_i2.p1 TRINITY_DN389_c0_g1~~TRINITY_DN389_c0_g1_i2.p1  ORF type:complete len:304 (+),score=23.62 TRINITY_DN389_c0_g1_i2:27-938(+)
MVCACFGLKCMKIWVMLSAILLFLLGAGFAYFCFTLSKSELAEAANIKSYLLAIGVCFLIVMIFISFSGCYGAKTLSKKALFIYILFMLLLTAGFVFVFYYLYNNRTTYTDDIDAICEENAEGQKDWVVALKESYPDNMYTYFCSATCPCKADKTEFTQADQTSTIYPDMKTDSVNGKTTLPDCDSYKQLYSNDPPDDKYIALMGVLEEEFNCSGFCSKEPFYYFSDVSRGVPEKGCQESLKDFIQQKFMIIFVVSLLLAVFCFSVLLSSCALCCMGGGDGPKSRAAMQNQCSQIFSVKFGSL